MARKLKKYEPASAFECDADAIYWLNQHYYFWFAGKPLHPSFVGGWPVFVFLRAAHNGSLTRAKIRGEYLRITVDRKVAKMQAMQGATLI